MENTVAFLISVGLICFGFIVLANAKLGSSPIWLAFALVPFAVGAISLFSERQTDKNPPG
jgi:hypothetical protein